LADILPTHRRHQGEGEFFVVEFLAEPEIALGVRHQGFVQPGLLLGNGLA
jgi:hypothetical protein